MTIPKTPFITVDTIIIENNELILIKRKNNPYKDQWALPGGFVEINETVEQASIRETKEETGLNVEIIQLEGVYSDPKRDPRFHTVTIVFSAKIISGLLKADSYAKDILKVNLDKINTINLAFDHNLIISNYLKNRKIK